MNEIANNPSGIYATLIWACTGISVVVFALMLYSIATFRRSPGTEASRGTTAEVLWAIVPIAVVFAMAAPAVRTIIGTDRTQHSETAQRTDPAPELANDTPEKAFHAGGVPL